MVKYVICNGVPSYGEAPVATDILKDNTSQILREIQAKKAVKNYLILDQNEKDLQVMLLNQADAFPGLNLEILPVEGSFGFVYGNSSALEKVIAGEKPIPSSQEINSAVFTPEKLLDPQTKHIYVDGSVHKKGQYTFPRRTTPADILSALGVKGQFKGLYLGHPIGLILGEGSLHDELELTTDYVRILSDEDCALDQLLTIARRYARESCGRCVFGHEGTTQINMILADISQKKGKAEDILLLQELCAEMRNQVLCEVGVSLATTVLSALTDFKEEIEGHITKKTCKSGVCGKFVTYHILAERCTGCTDCQDACQDEAILGKKKFIHVIEQEECTQCGACVAACEEEAIVKAGAVKPRCPQKPIPCKR